MVLATVFTVLLGPAIPNQPFDLADVRLLDSPYKVSMDVHAEYLKKLEPDRFLARFRTNAGLEPKAEGYGGWESQGISGHSLGHYLSAISHMYRATGDGEFKTRIDKIVSELAECQAAREGGYFGAIPDEKRLWDEIRRGEIRSQGFDLNGLWVPWYTLHKMFSGLLDCHRLAGNRQALSVATKLADWSIDVTKNLTDEQWQRMLHCEHGGMNEVLAELGHRTGKAKYLELAGKFYHRAILDPLKEGRDILPGKHANTQFPKVIGLARIYEVTGDEASKKATEFFWQAVVNHHSYCIGGNSFHEYFGPADQFSDRLSTNTAETCNTYNMVKLTGHLSSWRARVDYADFAERAMLNHILASTNREDGGVTYYVSLQPGTARSYNRPFNDFTCCVGSGMENHSRYGLSIFSHEGREVLYVNQFIPSTLNWRETGLGLRLETKYPNDGKVSLMVTKGGPVRFDLRLRHPYWAKGTLPVRVNGELVYASEQPGRFASIQRTWRKGDIVEFEVPMALRTEPMPDNRSRFAVFYGPVVLAADLGPGRGRMDRVPVLVTGGQPIDQWLRRVPGDGLVFETIGVGRPDQLRLRPFFELVHERNIVYFDSFSEKEWAAREAAYRQEEERQKALEARTVDRLRVGEMQPERDHNLQGDKTSVGEAFGRRWRHASDGGWFSFEMKVDPARPVDLVLTYWGADRGGREFDILVEGTKLATERLTGRKGNAFLDVVYPIPQTLTDGKSKVTVKLQALAGMTAGGLFDARTLLRQ